MTVSYVPLKRAALVCLGLPSLIFAMGYLRWWIGALVAVLLLVAYCLAARDGAGEESPSVTLPLPHLLFLAAVAVAWCYLAGLGNLYAQSDDWAARNAIFRDLIRMEWPVVYEAKDAALVYYIGYWLPAALIGKGILLLGGELSVAWTVGNFALWMWSALCVLLVLLLVAVYLRVASWGRLVSVVLIVIFFSGIDIVGTLYNFFIRGWAFPTHVEWWTVYQFSSMTTALNWVFNQAIPAWMATMLFLCERHVRSYAFILGCLLAAAPLPAVGLGLYMLGNAACLWWHAARERRARAFLGDVFTVQNLFGVLTLLPIYFLYYKSNLAVSVGQAHTVRPPRDTGGLWLLLVLFLGLLAVWRILLRRGVRVPTRLMLLMAGSLAVMFALLLLDPQTRIQYFYFLLMEALLLLLLVWEDHRADPLLYLSWGIAMLCPLVTVGTAADFCMRASIPTVVVMMILCAKYLLDHADCLHGGASWHKVAYIALIAVLALGSMTAVMELYRGAREFILGKRAFDWIYTMDRIFTGALEGTDRNFIATGYREQLFFRYLAK